MRLTRFLLPLLALLTLPACRNELKESLYELDRLVARPAAVYEAGLKQEIDSLYRRFNLAASNEEKWECALPICHRYSNTNLESAKSWLETMYRLAATQEQRDFTELIELTLYTKNGEYKAVRARFENFPAPADGTRLAREYWSCGISLYSYLEEYDLMRQCCTNYLVSDSTGINAAINRAKLLKLDRKPEEALKILLEESHRHKPDNRLTYHIGLTYEELGEIRPAMLWLARSAIADLSRYMRGYMSLSELAKLLFAERDYNRAASYMDLALSDKLSLGGEEKIRNASFNYLTISQAVIDAERKRKNSLIVLVVLLLALLGAVGMLLRKNTRINYRLQETQKQLIEAGKIKERYLFRYMTLSMQYLTKVDIRRREYFKTAQREGLQPLLRQLRSIQDFYDDRDAFFRFFDQTFLSLYPDFIGQVNSLLREDSSLSLMEDGSLTTEMRIIAVTKLGMTEGEIIAGFLGCSLSTLYTYRTRLRNSAINRDTFFQDIMTL